VHYIHDTQGHIIAEADGANGATLREYIWLAANDNNEESTADLPLAVVTDVSTTPALLMVHSDHLARPIRMTDASRLTVWQASFTPWGEPQSISGMQALNLRFPGQYFQIETGLHYNWHRHYDTVTGRYAQPDPLRFIDGPSVYAYVGNSPVMRVDPKGLRTELPHSERPGSSPDGTKVCQSWDYCYLTGGATFGGAGSNLCMYSCPSGGTVRTMGIGTLPLSLCPQVILNQ